MCWYCGSPVLENGVIGRSALCSCGKALRSCRNCKFYLPDSRGSCSELKAENISDKENANFCDWFSINKSASSSGKEKAQAEEARRNFDKLFGG
jgi:hypothetical protein